MCDGLWTEFVAVRSMDRVCGVSVYGPSIGVLRSKDRVLACYGLRTEICLVVVDGPGSRFKVLWT